jgi:hypothetical protein
MKKFGFALALLSAVAMTVVPVTPSFAAYTVEKKSTPQWREMLAVITQEQMEILKAKAPNLYKRILAAKESNKPLVVTQSEVYLLQAFHEKSLADLRAGGVEWIAVVGASVIILTILWKPIFKTDPPPFLAKIGFSILCLFAVRTACDELDKIAAKEAAAAAEAAKKTKGASKSTGTTYASKAKEIFKRIALANSQPAYSR